MQQLSSQAPEASDSEYRAIEATLLETARGRWFLAEHGRRARRLDSALLEDAIGRLQTSLKAPPALLGKLQAEIEALQSQIAATRETLVARGSPALVNNGSTSAQTILKAAEDMHEIAWALQANPFDPKGCEQIARNAGRIYAVSQSHAGESERVVTTAKSLDVAMAQLEALLETVLHELQIDGARA